MCVILITLAVIAIIIITVLLITTPSSPPQKPQKPQQESVCLGAPGSADCVLSRPSREAPYVGYIVRIKGTDPSVSGKTCSFSGATAGPVSTNCNSVKGTHNWNDMGRPVFIYYPANAINALEPIPYVMYFSFNQWDEYDPKKPNTYGIVNPDSSYSCVNPSKACDPYSDVWMQLELQSFISAGFAVILTTMIADDSYQYLNCSGDEAKNLYNLCWNNGDNPDANYLGALFDLIDTGTLMQEAELIPAEPMLTLPTVSNPMSFSLNKRECGLIGYSVGSQTVSRYINEFSKSVHDRIPVLINAPTVSVACMVSGGSLHCYEFCNGDSTTIRGPDGPACKSQPSDYSPCWNRSALGCCPIDKTEPYFDDQNNYTDHPPVILVQTEHDAFADPRASQNYYNTIKKRGGIVELVTGLGGNHNLFPTAILPVLRFFVKYMPPSSYSMI